MPDAIASNFKFREWCDRLEDALRVDLPSLNAQAAANPVCIANLIHRYRPFLVPTMLEHLRSAPLTRDEARDALKAINFVTASVDTHLRRNGEAPGAGYEILDDMVPTLLMLAKLGDHPPTHSHVTYWLRNAGHLPLTFTGGRGEQHFNRAVCGTDAAMRALCHDLRDIDLVDPSAPERIAAAASRYGDVLDLYRGYRRSPPNNQPLMQHTEFVVGMRPYLAPTVIQGRKYFGANAAHIAPCLVADLLLGFDSPWYRDMIIERFDHMLPEEVGEMRCAFSRRSLPDVVFTTLGVAPVLATTIGPEELLARASRLPSHARRAIKALDAIYQVAIAVSQTHMGLINHFVSDAAARLDPHEAFLAESRSANGVRSTTGVSGAPIESGVKRLADMRLKNPIVRQLRELARAVPVAE